MTLDEQRHWFAALAPAEIPTWYVGPKSAVVVPPMPDKYAVQDPADRAAIEDFLDTDNLLPPHLQWFSDALDAHMDARDAAELDAAQLRYFGWRWYYAEQMVAADPSDPATGGV